MNPSAIIRFCLTAFLATGFAISCLADTVTTDPVGFVTVSCTNNSDTYVSVPFHQPAVLTGTLSSVPSLAGDSATLTPSGASGWTTNVYQNTYYVRFLSGNKLGSYYSVSANSSSTLTVALNGDTTISTAAAGDSIQLVPYWTLDTLFPVATQTTITPSAGNLGFQRQTQVLFPDRTGTGINLSASAVYFLNATTGWTKDTSGFPAAGSTVVPPDSYFIVRQPASSATSFTAMGNVETKQLVSPIATSTSGPQDNALALARPVPVALKDSGLSTGFVASDGNLGFQRKDQLLVFDNNTQGINKSASAVYFMVGNSWYQDTSGFPNSDDTLVFQPGTGVIIRKASTANGATAFWQNIPTY